MAGERFFGKEKNARAPRQRASIPREEGRPPGRFNDAGCGERKYVGFFCAAVIAYSIFQLKSVVFWLSRCTVATMFSSVESSWACEEMVKE